MAFLNQFNQIYSRQFGFPHSTSNTLINNVECIRQQLDKSEFACGVFVDLQKTFDTIDHEILFAKLNHYGICGLTRPVVQVIPLKSLSICLKF